LQYDTELKYIFITYVKNNYYIAVGSDEMLELKLPYELSYSRIVQALKIIQSESLTQGLHLNSLQLTSPVSSPTAMMARNIPKNFISSPTNKVVDNTTKKEGATSPSDDSSHDKKMQVLYY
jgi:hypothetical protein